jgi:hypothetical protein
MAAAAVAEALSTLGGLGIAIPAGSDTGSARESGGAGEVGAQVLARLDAAALQPLPPPPRGAAGDGGTDPALGERGVRRRERGGR